MDMTISADRLGSQKTQNIHLDKVVLLQPMLYHVNMYPENALDITRANTAVSIPYHPKFGEITDVTIDGESPKISLVARDVL